MGFLSVLSMARSLVSDRAGAGDAVVDATAGNGVDTLFLTQTVGSNGSVFAFDVQEAALARTRQRLVEGGALGEGVTLLHAGHERMFELVPSSLHGRLRAVMFNLGYLPGADESLVTVPATTLVAANTALDLLSAGGVLTAVVYPGHAGGSEEAAAVEHWAANVPAGLAQTVIYRFAQKSSAPYLIALEKR